MIWEVRVTDVAIVIATLLGPVLAVQAQKWLERRRERGARRLALFRTLMATRAARLAPDHVRALNGIPLEFYGTKKPLKKIRDAWKVYFSHLSTPHTPETVQSWQQKSDDLFIDLLRELAGFLGYDEFNMVELGKEVYAPQAHLAYEEDNLAIRQGLSAVFKGEAAMPVSIHLPALDPEAEKFFKELGEAVLADLKERPPKRGARKTAAVLDKTAEQLTAAEQLSLSPKPKQGS